MKYTLPKSYTNAGLQVNIPEDILKRYRSELGSTKAAVDKWLYENDYVSEDEYKAILKTDAPSRKTTKREFKVDQEKSEIITFLNERLREYEDENGNMILNNIEIVNPNRTISFSLGDNKYEVTLVRKKK